MPRKEVMMTGIGTVPGARFNEAGALCPGKSRDHLPGSRLDRVASMRPGHCAPERAGTLGCDWDEMFAELQ